MRFFLSVKKNLVPLLALSIGGGLVAGYRVDLSFLKPLVGVLLYVMIFPMMVTLSTGDVLKSLKSWKPMALSLAINFVLAPGIAIFLGRVFLGEEPMMALGLYLAAVLPTSGMTASWTGLAEGNLRLSLAMMSVNLLAAAFLLPFYLRLFSTGGMALGGAAVFSSVLKVVLIPLVLGDATRRLLLKRFGSEGYRAMKPIFGGVSSLGVILVVFIAVAMKSPVIVDQWPLAIRTLAPVGVLYAVLMGVSHWAGRLFLRRADAVALVYATTMRNLTIALGILMSVSGESMAVFLLALAYMVQVPVGAVYMKISRRGAVKQAMTKLAEVGNV